MIMGGIPQETIDADVLIIGSGVVGSLMAWTLSSRGLNVAMLDAGAPVDRAAAIDRFKKNAGKEANSPYQMMPWAPVPDDVDPYTYYVQPGHDSKDPRLQIGFKGFFMRLVGGTSWHWTGHAERMFPGDFKTRSLYGHGVDWPLSYEDLQPFYYRVEKTWGVAGDAECTAPPRDTPYPMPVVPRSYLDRQVGLAGLAAIGHDSQPVPHSRNSVPNYNDRPQCCGNSSCLPICPIGAKYDASVHVGMAQTLGTQVYANRVAFQVAVGPDQKVSGVYYKNFDNGANDRLDTIASGMTTHDRTTFADALAIIDAYGLRDKVPANVITALSLGVGGHIPETLKAGDAALGLATNILIGTNRTALLAACNAARSLGYNVAALTSSLTGEAKEAAKFLFSIARDTCDGELLVKRPACIIAGGETVVTLTGTGKGGRNQELALAFLVEMARDGREGRSIHFLSASTDGSDGPTDAAGAFASTELLETARRFGLNLEACLRDNDSYHFFERVGGLLKTGPTMTNVCDLHMVVVT